MVKSARIIFIILLYFSYLTAFSQPQFIAKADKYTVGKNEQFTVTFTINEQATKFAAPDFGDFQVIQGPMTSQNTIIQNFEMVVQISYTFVLRPRRVGLFTISAASIQVGSEKVYSKPFEIKVVQQSPQSDNPNDPQNIAKRLAYTRVKVSKRTVSVGEPFVASYQLLTRVNVGTPTEIESLSYSSAYKKDLDPGSQKRPEQEVIDGEVFQVFTLKEHLIIPQKEGVFAPGSIAWEVPTQIPTNQRDFFGRQMVQTVKQISESRFPSVTVKPLPAEGKPSNFSGGVGDIKLTVMPSRTEVKANESIALTMEISGAGNIKLTDFPELEIPTAIEAFDPKYTERITESKNGMSGSKKKEYLLLPRFKGDYKIPSVKFTFFHPKSGTYKTITTDEITLSVIDGPALPGQNTGAASSNPNSSEKVTYLNDDILYIKTTTDPITKLKDPFIASPTVRKALLFYPLYALLILAVVLLGRTLNKQTPEKKKRTAKKQLRIALLALEKKSVNAYSENFYNELSNVLWTFFENLLDLKKSEQSIENLKGKLEGIPVSHAVISKIEKLFTKCEMVKYSPNSTATIPTDIKVAKEIVESFENISI